MHLIIYFCGTGNPGQDFDGPPELARSSMMLAGSSAANHEFWRNEENRLREFYKKFAKENGETCDSSFYEYAPADSSKMATVVVKGCEHSEVCNSAIFPDLHAFAQRFTKTFFNVEGGLLKINTSKDEDLKIGIDRGRSTAYVKTRTRDVEQVESITLCGYSRGAVTCFEVAKQLQQIAPRVPVDIIVNQPVPGNCYQGPGTNAGSIADCSDLENVKNVSIILGAYTGAIQKQDGSEDTSKIHRGFFSQIVPKLPSSAKRELIVIPRQSHHQLRVNSPDGGQHMHMQLAKSLREKGLVNDDAVKAQTELAALTYASRVDDEPDLFPPAGQLQGFFGLSTKQAYRHLDKLHPQRALRNGFRWNGHEELIDWWERHDKNASRFSSDETKHLVKTIKATDKNNEDDLKKLLSHADRWLMLKENTDSSRYYQVESLRNNIYYELRVHRHVPKADLAKVSRTDMARTKFFLRRWTEASDTIAWFKTDATRELDAAFLAHAKSNDFKVADKTLIAALDKWLQLKKDSGSKRYGLVIEMREQLQKIHDSYDVQNIPRASM